MNKSLGHLALLLLTSALAACSTNASRVDAVRYDFGLAGPVEADSGIAAVELIAPSWLTGDAIEYRLAHVDPASRRAYADSRWAASPAELLRVAMQHRFAGRGNCRVRLELDEFLQVFDSAQAARQQMVVRAVLLVGGTPTDHRVFSITESAPTADARGAVLAAGQGVRQLGDQMSAWLAPMRESCRLPTGPAK
jgi:cholesterol transport system auxiliary component